MFALFTPFFPGNGTITLRASGTEPKLKYYLEVVSDAAQASAAADRLVQAVDGELVKSEEAGLRRQPTES